MAGEVSTNFGEFIRELQRTSDEIKREVGALIPAAAERMASYVTSRYPIGPTGRLRSMVRVRTLPSQDALLPARRVTGAPHAYIWQEGATDHGTVDRINYTRHGANKGKSPAHAPKFWERTAVVVRGDFLRQSQAILDRPRVIGGGLTSPGGSGLL